MRNQIMTLLLPPYLRPHYQAELRAARAAYASKDLAAAFRHLERAHILGQRSAFAHSHVHALMLRHGLRTGSGREIRGQLIRIVFGFFMSLVGRVPAGNTGGANVPPEKPMPIPEDLLQIISQKHD
jgi:hypothetical protein